MLLLSITHDYFVWHYTRAFKELFGVWINLLWFVVHYFSITELLRSWFAPFKRITEERRRGFNFEDFAGYVIINILSRVVGAIIRTFILFAGLVSLVGTIAAGFLVYVVWIFLPVLILATLVAGISLLFT